MLCFRIADLTGNSEREEVAEGKNITKSRKWKSMALNRRAVFFPRI